MQKTIYELELHETLFNNMRYGLRNDITRVAGGWIYQPIVRLSSGNDMYLTPVFVPFNNEFQL